jgi:DNA uptake protein ComE-like DNA-binding protein
VRGFEFETNGLLSPAGVIRFHRGFARSSFGGGEGEETVRVSNGARRESASVLIVVLWIAIGLVSIALYFAHAMTFELRASDNRASGLASEQAIEGAARYVGAVLSNLATNGAVPVNTEFSCEAVPLGDSRFWIIGRDPAGTSASEPYFGLIDEGSKLNMNRAGTNTLSYLPNMTLDVAQAITDWRDTNGTLTLDYAQLGYQPKHADFETVDELRLVEGMTIDLLVGDDHNRNGVLDGSEKSSGNLSDATSGLFEYLTVYSREPNFHADGSALTNINTQAGLQALLQNAVGTTRAGQIMFALGYNGGQGGGAPPPTFTSLLGFYVELNRRGLMNSTDFANIYNDATTAGTNTLFINGRVNVNTASEAVLTALFMGIGIDQNTAQGAAESLVTYREQNPENLTSISWIVDALGSTSQVVPALASRDLVTTRSFQFTADIAAVGPFGRGYRRVKFVFDITEGTPKIIYRQDLGRLGWALGEKARETWVAKETK